MINTSIAAAYAAQYAKVCKTEPRAGRDDLSLHPYTYLLLDDLAKFLPDEDPLKEQMEDYGFELHVNDDCSLKLYNVPGHIPGGERVANRTPYCGEIEFVDSKKPSEVNIRNVVYAARTLVDRHLKSTELLVLARKMFNGKPLPHSELAEYVANEYVAEHGLIRSGIKRYSRFLREPDGSNVDKDQVIAAITVLDNIRRICGITYPFIPQDPGCFRHYLENILKLSSDKVPTYLSTDSCAVAMAIFFEDHFDSSEIKEELKMPAIYEVFNALDSDWPSPDRGTSLSLTKAQVSLMKRLMTTYKGGDNE